MPRELAYIDANILVAYCLGEKSKEYQQAKSVMEKAIRGECIIVISYFTLSETLIAIKRIIAKDKYEKASQHEINKLKKYLEKDESCREVHGKAFNILREIIENILIDREHFIIEPIDGYDYPAKLFYECYNLLKDSVGAIKIYPNRCQTCNTILTCNKCKRDSIMMLKGVNSQDILHVLIAKSLNCTIFYTMDKWFEEIKNKITKPKIEILQ